LDIMIDFCTFVKENTAELGREHVSRHDIHQRHPLGCDILRHSSFDTVLQVKTEVVRRLG
jgi:hypothetical protein